MSQPIGRASATVDLLGELFGNKWDLTTSNLMFKARFITFGTLV